MLSFPEFSPLAAGFMEHRMKQESESCGADQPGGPMPPVTFEITPSKGSIRARDILQFLTLADKLETSVEMDWIKEYRAPKKQKYFQSKRMNEKEGVIGLGTPIFSNHFSRMNQLFL